jgi:hypothetical protein
LVSIDVLPDDVLLAIFDFCVDEDPETKREIEAWQSLVHVCRRWRSVVFGSPNHLNLELVCTPKTPARDTLDVWPALPLRIQGGADLEEGVDNIVAVLERSDRVREISLWDVSNSDSEKLLAAMAGPIPGADVFVALVVWRGSPSRFVLGWICTSSAIPLLGCHSISGITETSFVCHSPRRTFASKHSSFRLHFTRGGGHCTLQLDQPQTTYTSIPIPSISP